MGRRSQFREEAPAIFRGDDLRFFTTNDVDVTKVHTEADLRRARKIAAVRRAMRVTGQRQVALDEAMARIREWGVGALVQGLRAVGRVYIISIYQNRVGVRRSLTFGRVRNINPEWLTLVRSSTKKARQAIEAHVRRKEKKRRAA